jgi:hypothetical protein
MSEEYEDSAPGDRQAKLDAAKAAENFALLDSLSKSAAWKWFYAEALEAAVYEAREAALDVESRSAAHRDAAAQQYAFGVKLLGLLDERRRFWASRAGIAPAG